MKSHTAFHLVPVSTPLSDLNYRNAPETHNFKWSSRYPELYVI